MIKLLSMISLLTFSLSSFATSYTSSGSIDTKGLTTKQVQKIVSSLNQEMIEDGASEAGDHFHCSYKSAVTWSDLKGSELRIRVDYSFSGDMEFCGDGKWGVKVLYDNITEGQTRLKLSEPEIVMCNNSCL